MSRVAAAAACGCNASRALAAETRLLVALSTEVKRREKEHGAERRRWEEGMRRMSENAKMTSTSATITIRKLRARLEKLEDERDREKKEEEERRRSRVERRAAVGTQTPTEEEEEEEEEYIAKSTLQPVLDKLSVAAGEAREELRQRKEEISSLHRLLGDERAEREMVEMSAKSILLSGLNVDEEASPVSSEEWKGEEGGMGSVIDLSRRVVSHIKAMRRKIENLEGKMAMAASNQGHFNEALNKEAAMIEALLVS